ncbi:MAG TPA: thioredoxin [candidate division WOR-3 bacterium]|uniref:Thioredoxin n=1 Tax=candidate division WOR-3 bacterium TaxID=2052148 RepID=A0A7V0T7E8_UNCW3|nr:thioredoxin [candidate division WOR-3 bacterium]
MKRTTIAATVAVLMLVLLAGCPVEPGVQAEPAKATVAEYAETADTLMPVDNTVSLEEEPVPAAPEPASETKPEPPPAPEPVPELPPPKPKILPRMWAFGADRCIPCVQMRPFLTELVDEYAGRVEVIRFDVYQDREQATQARIQMIPTQIFYDPEGKELFRHVGFYEKDSIIAKFRQFGWE